MKNPMSAKFAEPSFSFLDLPAPQHSSYWRVAADLYDQHAAPIAAELFDYQTTALMGTLGDDWTPALANILPDVNVADVEASWVRVRERIEQQLDHSLKLSQLSSEIRSLRSAVEALGGRVEVLAQNLSQTVCVPLRSLDLDSLEVVKPFDIVITPEEDGFQANFLDAKLHAYGESMDEALSNIKSTIVESYQRLSELPENRLGRSMRAQKELLGRYVREVRVD